jgi:hypothetical protein
MAAAPADYDAIVANADKLPDVAILPDPAAAKLLHISVSALNRNNPVPPIQITPQRRGRRLGDIRKLGQLAPATT